MTIIIITRLAALESKGCSLVRVLVETLCAGGGALAGAWSLPDNTIVNGS